MKVKPTSKSIIKLWVEKQTVSKKFQNSKSDPMLLGGCHLNYGNSGNIRETARQSSSNTENDVICLAL